jgi:phage shock protein A
MSLTPSVPGPGSESRIIFPDLDAAYRKQLEALARVRRVVATAATSRKKLELRLGEIEGEASERGAAASSERAEVLLQLEAARAEERRVTEASQRFQAKISALHNAQVGVEAAYLAAEEAARATLAEVTGS